MKRAVWISLLALLAFAIILIARLPVQWVAGFIPKNISCAQLSGTVWNGTCSDLTAQGVQVGEVSWQLRALPLLSRKVSAHVDVARGAHFVRADVEASSDGRLIARNVQADVPLDRALIPQLPPNLTGDARANLAVLKVEKGAVTAVEGQLEADNLIQGAGSQRAPLGDYSLTFPPADPSAEPVGQLKSLRGPLDVVGTLKLTREPGFVLEGQVAAGREAAPQLVRQLAYLGSPDEHGRRPFSLAATF